MGTVARGGDPVATEMRLPRRGCGCHGGDAVAKAYGGGNAVARRGCGGIGDHIRWPAVGGTPWDGDAVAAGTPPSPRGRPPVAAGTGVPVWGVGGGWGNNETLAPATHPRRRRRRWPAGARGGCGPRTGPPACRWVPGGTAPAPLPAPRDGWTPAPLQRGGGREGTRGTLLPPRGPPRPPQGPPWPPRVPPPTLRDTSCLPRDPHSLPGDAHPPPGTPTASPGTPIPSPVTPTSSGEPPNPAGTPNTPSSLPRPQ